MAIEFNQDPFGCVLEVLYYHKNKDHNKMMEWMKAQGFPYTHVEQSPLIGDQIDIQLLRLDLNKYTIHNSPVNLFDHVIMKLMDKALIQKTTTTGIEETTFRELTNFGMGVFKDGSYRALINGFLYIYEWYKKSILAITNNSNSGIGTGFLIRPNIVITCKHVLEYLSKNSKERIIVKFLDDANKECDVTFKNIIFPDDNDLDIAAIILSDELTNSNSFILANDTSLLDDVITMGFPKIPLVDKLYLIVHKGEVVCLPRSYFNTTYLIVSELIRGGNSGAPVINRFGKVVGMITENLITDSIDDNERDIIQKLGYSCAIPIAIFKQFIGRVINDIK